MSTIAAIVEGNVDLADVLFLLAVFCFVVAAVIAVVRQAVEGALLPAGLACVALALLVL